MVVVIPADRSGPQLRVRWGWRDFWLEPPHGAGPEPQVVTPRFVAAAIRFALAHGWEPDVNGPPFLLDFNNDKFLVANHLKERPDHETAS